MTTWEQHVDAQEDAATGDQLAHLADELEWLIESFPALAPKALELKAEIDDLMAPDDDGPSDTELVEAALERSESPRGRPTFEVVTASGLSWERTLAALVQLQETGVVRRLKIGREFRWIRESLARQSYAVFYAAVQRGGNAPTHIAAVDRRSRYLTNRFGTALHPVRVAMTPESGVQGLVENATCAQCRRSYGLPALPARRTR